MTVAYAPAPGTVAYRALAHLETLDRGAELTSAQLAEAIRVPPANIPGSLQSALDHRVVFSRKKGGHLRSPAFWSLVDHSAAAVSDKPASLSPAAGNAAPAHRTTPVRDSQQVLKAEGDGPDATDRETPAMRSPVGGPTGAGQPAAAGPIEASPNTPQEGANRDASAGQSHVAGGSASPAGRGADGPTARGAAPDLSSYIGAIAERHPPDRVPPSGRRGLRLAAWSTGEIAIELTDGEVIVFDKVAATQVVEFCRRIGGGA